MDREQAMVVLKRNYNCEDDSFVYDLYEKSMFSVKHFWAYYDSVICLAEDVLLYGKDIDIARKITFVYQTILKNFIWHFDQHDLSNIAQFPSNYDEYIERLDGAFDAYFCGIFVEDGVYALKRNCG